MSWLLSCCYSHKRMIQSSLPYSEKFNWPKAFKPADSDVFIHHEIDINASALVVWDILIHAAKWPEWYNRAEGLTLVKSADGKLGASGIFIWKPAGKFTAAIKEFNPPYHICRLGKTDHEKMTVYNARVIMPSRDGCKAILYQTRNGPKTKMEKILAPYMISNNIWQSLMGLKEKAEKQSKNQHRGGFFLNQGKMRIKKIMLAVLLVSGASQSSAQDKIMTSKWPVPTNVQGLLFYIQRDPDINTVCYTVKLNDDGDVDLKDPIDIFWIRYAENGKRKKLSTIQREFGYGLSFKPITADSILVKALSFPNRAMHLVRNQNKSYVVKMKISGHICELKRIYLRITGGSALAPQIEYIEFYGVDPQTRELITDRIDLR